MFLDKVIEEGNPITRESKSFKGKTDTMYRLTLAAYEVILTKKLQVTAADLKVADEEDEKACEKLKPQWLGFKCAYMQGVGKIIVGSPEVEKYLESCGVKVTPKFGTVVISWPLYDDKVDEKKVLANPEKVEIAPFVVGLRYWKELDGQHKNKYLWDCDLSGSLEPKKPENYQTWVFARPGKRHGEHNQLRRLLEAAEKTPALRVVTDNLISRILEAAETVETTMGKTYNTVAELKARLASADKAGGHSLSDSSAVDATASDVDVESLMSSLQGNVG